MYLTDAELNAETFNILSNLNIKGFGIIYPVFHFLQRYGFRSNEVYMWRDWDFVDDDSTVGLVSFPTSKRGTHRFIPFSDLSLLFQQTILEGKRSFYLPQYRSLSKYFSNSSGYRYFNGNKNITTHIFRHNRIKQLHLLGLSNEEIQHYMGLLKLETVDVYLNSHIYRTPKRL